MTKTNMLSGFLLMCCSSAHMVLMVDIYRIKGLTPYNTSLT